jgi:ACT domain-containing protein
MKVDVILFVVFFVFIIMLFSVLTIKFKINIKDSIKINIRFDINGILLYKKNINLDFESIIILFGSRSKNRFNKYKDIVIELIKLLPKKFYVQKNSITMNIGLLDAAITCIAAGLLNNIIILFFLFSKSYVRRMDNLYISVKPQFNTLCFDCTANCIIKIRIGYIIWESIRAFKITIFRRWANGRKSHN